MLDLPTAESPNKTTLSFVTAAIGCTVLCTQIHLRHVYSDPQWSMASARSRFFVGIH